MNKKIILILFSVIILLALFLRLWQLGEVPSSPDWDEVALGFDANSIIQTGKDQFGKFLPVVLRSFDDYKPALYAYLSIPSTLVFGLNVFAVRFPSAIFGVISVISVFFLIKELLRDYKYKDTLALISSFLMAISPWSLQFSRVAFEANVGSCFNILIALFFLKGLKKPVFLFISALFIGLSPYIYQSTRVFTPLLVIALILIYRKELFKLSKKYLISSFIFIILILMPMALYILTDSSSLLRVKGTSIFSYQTELLKTNTQKLDRDLKNNNKLGFAIDNRRIVYAKTIISGYISHFDLNWLFTRGDISRHHAPNIGLLYLFEFPLILIGIYTLIFKRFEKKTKYLLFSWFLIAPIPASVTTGVPHAVRTLNFLPIWHIFSAIGFIALILAIQRFKKIKCVLYVIFASIFIFNFSFFLNQYFVQQNYYYSKDWQYGYEKAINEIKPIQKNYKKIVISDKQPMDKSYMFFAFYLNYPPDKYQEVGKNSSGSFVAHQRFGKYEFRPIDWSKDSMEKNVLYLGNPDEIPEDVSFKTIYNLDGTPAMRLAKT